MSNKITINLSSTALGQSACILRFYRTVVEGYKATPSAKIVYGVAVHKFLDTMYKTNGNISESFKEMKKAFSLNKIPETVSKYIMEERHLMTTCLNLWTEWCENDSKFELITLDEKVVSETPFLIPAYYEDDYILVNLCGTIDKIGQFKGGCFAIGDWKTTGYSGYKKEFYFRRYELSRQTRFYILACKLLAEREPESTLGRIGMTNMGAFIDGIFLAPDANDNKVIRSDVYQYSTKDLSDFRLTLDLFIRKLSDHVATNCYYKEGILNGSCQGQYECQFYNACKAPDNIAEIILAKDFRKVPFQPLDYNELD